MDAIVIVICIAAFGVAGFIISLLLIALSLHRLIVPLSVEHKALVTALAIAGLVSGISDLVYAVAFAGDNWFDNVCRLSRYCSLFVVLSIPTTLFINSCGRLIEVRKRTPARRFTPLYCLITVILIFICVVLVPSSTGADECSLHRSTVLARGVYVLAFGSLTMIVIYFTHRKLQELCATTTTATNANSRALLLRVRESRQILVSTVLLTVYVTLMEVLLAVLSQFESVEISLIALLNALNSPVIGALLFIVLPQYRTPFCGAMQPPRKHMLEPSKMATEAESVVPRIVIIRSPSAPPQRSSGRPLSLARGQRKGASPFPPAVRHLYDASSSPSASFSSSTTENNLSPRSTVWSTS